MTAAQIQAVLTVLYEAELRAANGVTSYTINLGGTSRTVMRRSMKEIRKDIEYYEGLLDSVNNSGSLGVFGLPTKYGTPADER